MDAVVAGLGVRVRIGQRADSGRTPGRAARAEMTATAPVPMTSGGMTVGTGGMTVGGAGMVDSGEMTVATVGMVDSAEMTATVPSGVLAVSKEEMAVLADQMTASALSDAMADSVKRTGAAAVARAGGTAMPAAVSGRMAAFDVTIVPAPSGRKVAFDEMIVVTVGMAASAEMTATVPSGATVGFDGMIAMPVPSLILTAAVSVGTGKMTVPA